MPAPPDSLVALGDSITYGEGGIVRGVDGRSWALWLAQALDVAYVNYAVNGARVPDLLRDQLPRVRRHHGLGLLYVGVNDVRDPAFDPAAFDAGVREVARGLGAATDRLVVLTIPLDLGRPRAGAKVSDANASIRVAAAENGALVVELEDLAGRTWVLPDAVHPTALGQLEIADRVARALGAPVLPSARTPPHAGGRLATDVDWGRMWVREQLRARVRQAAAARRSRS